MNVSVVLDIYGYCMGYINNEIFFLGMLKKCLIWFSDFFNFLFLRKLILGIILLFG